MVPPNYIYIKNENQQEKLSDISIPKMSNDTIVSFHYMAKILKNKMDIISNWQGICQ